MEQGQITRPMMYIEQPELRHPRALMQAQFASAHHSPPESRTKNKNEVHASHRDAPFQELSIEEKITYLLHVPEQMPALKCKIITEEETWIGVITDVEEADIVLRVRGNRKEFIAKADITAIRLIGF